MNLQIITKDNVTYDFSQAGHKSAKILADNKEIQLDLIERSFSDGGQVDGERRIQASTLELSVDINCDNDIDFRSAMNDLMYYCKNAQYIRDSELNTQTKIEMQTSSSEYDDGGMLRGSRLTVAFLQIDPYWEDVEYTSLDYSGASSYSESIVNSGSLPASPVITITTAILNTAFLAYISENNEGIEVQDLSFGSTSVLLVYTVDCEQGIITLAGINRNNRIKGGTGFFKFPVGTFTLVIEALEDVSVNVKYKRRYFV